MVDPRALRSYIMPCSTPTRDDIMSTQVNYELVKQFLCNIMDLYAQIYTPILHLTYSDQFYCVFVVVAPVSLHMKWSIHTWRDGSLILSGNFHIKILFHITRALCHSSYHASNLFCHYDQLWRMKQWYKLNQNRDAP